MKFKEFMGNLGIQSQISTEANIIAIVKLCVENGLFSINDFFTYKEDAIKDLQEAVKDRLEELDKEG